jgi:hypothetical protein
MESLQKKMKKMSANRQGGRINKEEYENEMSRLTKELKRIQKEAQEALRKAK